ncbi:MAG: 30S ribosome-binding factor RbfA [Chloroflexi bacterium]|nr:30S ribosome-binding factor RbfA [Chloroflexota bacterium]
MTRRMEQVADLLQSEIAELLRREVKHPALTDAMLSITRVEVAPDLATARIHVSMLRDPASEPADEGALIAALTRSEPFLHRMLVKRLHLRRVPRLHFLLDRSIAEGDRLTALMRDVAHGEGRDL